MYPTQTTRGGEGSNLNSPSISSNKSKFFKPVVAGSLALLLTAGIASAADCDGTSTGTKPQICYGTNQGAMTDKTSTLQKLKVDATDGVVTPKISDSGDTTINTLIF